MKSFYTLLNAAPLGFRYYKIFFRFSQLPVSVEQEMIDYLTKENSCASIRLIEGSYNMVFVTVQHDISNLRKFLTDFYNIYAGAPHRTSFSQIDKANDKIDIIDKNILKLLTTDARMKLLNIALALKIDSSKVKYRIKRLEAKNIIVAYTTSLAKSEGIFCGVLK